MQIVTMAMATRCTGRESPWQNVMQWMDTHLLFFVVSLVEDDDDEKRPDSPSRVG